MSWSSWDSAKYNELKSSRKDAKKPRRKERGQKMLNRDYTLQHGRYRIIRVIGQGGMGAVYEAYDNNLSSRVSVRRRDFAPPQ